MNLRRWIFIGLLLAGAWQLGEGGWIHAKAWLGERLIEDAWFKTRGGDDRVVPWPWADTWPVARLEVPRLGISRYILAGGHGRALAFGPGWLEGTAAPGSEGRSVISGHRDTHLGFLAALKVGDRLIIRKPGGGDVIYAVMDRQVFHERDGWLLAPTDQQQLVLITCYPFDTLIPGGPQRFVVTADALSM